jgi:hypothetical protein
MTKTSIKGKYYRLNTFLNELDSNFLTFNFVKKLFRSTFTPLKR